VEEGGEAASGADEVVDEELLVPAVEVGSQAGQVLVPERADRRRRVAELVLGDAHLAEPLDGEHGRAAIERRGVRRPVDALAEHLGRRAQQRLQIVRRRGARPPAGRAPRGR
jgi:hypothetical protein